MNLAKAKIPQLISPRSNHVFSTYSFYIVYFAFYILRDWEAAMNWINPDDTFAPTTKPIKLKIECLKSKTITKYICDLVNFF